MVVRVSKKRFNGARLSNTLAQHPLCFPPLMQMLDYDVSEDGKLLMCVDGDKWPVARGYSGRVVKTKKGAYCIGYYGKKHVDAFMELEVFFDKMPTKFDRKVLASVITRSDGTRNIRFKSIYDLMKSAGLSPKGPNYDKIIKSLWKWSTIQMHFIGSYAIKDNSGIDVSSFGVLSRFSIPDRGCRGAVDISLDMDFLDLLSGNNTTLIENKILLNLNSESSMNLYSYLKSFDLLLESGKSLKRDLKDFSDNVLSSGKSPSRQKDQIAKALSDINKNTPDGVSYRCSFTKNKHKRHIVAFRKTKAKELPSLKKKKSL